MKNLKVIKIVNDTTLVLKGGKTDGVTVGDKYRIMDQTGDILIDPDTEEEVGRLPVYKAVVEITDVYEKYSIARSEFVEEKQRTTPSFSEIMAPMPALGKKQTTIVPAHYKTLDVNPDQITGGLYPTKNHPISLGDLAKKYN